MNCPFTLIGSAGIPFEPVPMTPRNVGDIRIAALVRRRCIWPMTMRMTRRYPLVLAYHRFSRDPDESEPYLDTVCHAQSHSRGDLFNIGTGPSLTTTGIP